MNPEEAPVCTCICRNFPSPFGDMRIVRVFDPFCQIKAHKDVGTYTGPEPTYEATKAPAPKANDYTCRECGNPVLYRSDHKEECKHYPGGPS